MGKMSGLGMREHITLHDRCTWIMYNITTRHANANGDPYDLKFIIKKYLIVIKKIL